MPACNAAASTEEEEAADAKQFVRNGDISEDERSLMLVRFALTDVSTFSERVSLT